MKQIKILKKSIESISNFETDVDELQKEVNNYITTNGYYYDDLYKCYKKKERNGFDVLKITPLLNGCMLMIVLEMESSDVIE